MNTATALSRDLPGIIPDRDGPTDRKWRGQSSVSQSLRHPLAVSIGAVPCQDFAVGLDAENGSGVAMDTDDAI